MARSEWLETEVAVCASCKVRHAPYTCEQYQRLRQAENAADDARVAGRRQAAAEIDGKATGRRRWWSWRRRTRSS